MALSVSHLQVPPSINNLNTNEFYQLNTNRYICGMNSQSSKAERTKSFIIESTAEIFNKKGFAGTSLSDLSEATGLTKGSIYGNFENKEEVAIAVFEYNCAKVSRLISEQVDKAETFYDKLMVYPKIYKKLNSGSASHGGCPILNTATEADDTNELLKNKAADAIRKWERNLCQLIKKGIDAGEFRKEVNVRRTALSIIALIEGAVMISKVTADASSMDHILGTVESLINQMKN